MALSAALLIQSSIGRISVLHLSSLRLGCLLRSMNQCGFPSALLTSSSAGPRVEPGHSGERVESDEGRETVRIEASICFHDLPGLDDSCAPKHV